VHQSDQGPIKGQVASSLTSNTPAFQNIRPSLSTVTRPYATLIINMPFTGYGAFTAPINPSGATPVITYDQVWKALVFKAGKPQAFVPVIDQCNVVSRSESGLTRKVIFKEGKGPAEGWVTEEITFLGNSRVRTTSCFWDAFIDTNMYAVSRLISSWSKLATRSRTS
jgi:hypothetical protein